MCSSLQREHNVCPGPGIEISLKCTTQGKGKEEKISLDLLKIYFSDSAVWGARELRSEPGETALHGAPHLCSVSFLFGRHREFSGTLLVLCWALTKGRSCSWCGLTVHNRCYLGLGATMGLWTEWHNFPSAESLLAPVSLPHSTLLGKTTTGCWGESSSLSSQYFLGKLLLTCEELHILIVLI